MLQVDLDMLNVSLGTGTLEIHSALLNTDYLDAQLVSALPLNPGVPCCDAAYCTVAVTCPVGMRYLMLRDSVICVRAWRPCMTYDIRHVPLISLCSRWPMATRDMRRHGRQDASRCRHEDGKPARSTS